MQHSSLLLVCCLVPLPVPATAAELTVATWGGAYEAAQRVAFFEPYASETGTEIEVAEYSGGTTALVARAEQEGWDVIDMLEDQALVACSSGSLLEIDHVALLGSDALDDFEPANLYPCSVPNNVYALVSAYDDRRFPGLKPSRIEDFFDTERFPGRRALAKSPDGVLEWALMADGVPPEQVYSLLSTDRGLRLAFRRLDTIRDDILWWEDAGEPAEMLGDGRVVMASGYNGRFFDLAEHGGAAISIVWDGRLIGYEVWAIPASSDAPVAARDFIAFATLPETMARLSERIPYGPARQSAFGRIGLDPLTGTPMRLHLPNAPQHGARALVRDSQWYANTAELRRRRFEQWLAEGIAAETEGGNEEALSR